MLDINIAYNIVAQLNEAMENTVSYIFGEDRTQSTISSLDEQISADNPVRLIDLLVNMLYSEDLGNSVIKGTKRTGRPAYHPKHMIKLYIYGYMNKIASSRRLELEAKRNIELKWLINNICPDFKTISDFRKDNQDAITNMTYRFNQMLKDKGLIVGELMALDGTRIKANAGANELSCEQLAASLQDIEADLERYFSLLQHNDLKDELDELDTSALDNVDKIAAKILELQAKQAQLQEFQKHASGTKRGKVNPTDPESRMMKGRKESFSGYNLQIIVDSLFKLIASAQVTQSLNDRNEMIPALQNLKETMGIEPAVLLADNGYNNTVAIQAIEAEGKTEALVMIGEEKNPEDSYSKWSFRYDEEKDCYYCPMGNVLKRIGGIQKHKNRLLTKYQCKKQTCDSCPIRAKCMTGKEGRAVTRYTDEKWVEAYRKKVQSPRNKALLRRRKAIVEHVFGVLKCWMGKIPLLLRGRKKVQTEINLYTTAYNLKRLIKLFGFDGVTSMIMAKWKDNLAFFASLASIFDLLFPRIVSIRKTPNQILCSR